MSLNNTECIVLAGGLGTRLRDTIGDLPKCMAPVAGKPFLEHLLYYVLEQGITRTVISLGYKSETVIDWLRGLNIPLQIDWVIEKEPLGTGGGMRLAMEQCSSEEVFALNGDTMFRVDLREMYQQHILKDAETTIALKPMEYFSRYGIVRTYPSGHAAEKVICSFEEKIPTERGDINGGIYCINRKAFLKRPASRKFSFEVDYLEQFVKENRFYGFHSEGYFIDIGVPEDYARAQRDFKTLFPA